jgi:transposase
LVGRGGKRYIIDGEVLRGIVDAHSDFTLAQLAAAYAERMQSPTPHISTVDRALTRLGYTLKKKDASVRRAR